MKIYFAMWLTDPTLGESLTKKEAKNRLGSYYFLKDQSITSEMLRTYIKTGTCNPRKNKK